MQVHYLSPLIQNEFINICAQHVISVILEERYYAIIVDATPDSINIEQNTFILRYVNLEKKVIHNSREISVFCRLQQKNRSSNRGFDL